MMRPTLVIWWRYGKEHSEEEFRLNPPAIIAAHLDAKAACFRQTPEAEWRWWHVDDDLIVERPVPDNLFYREDTRIYYLPMRGLAVIENIHLQPPYDIWSWYLHLANITYDSDRATWVKQDLFCDILIGQDGHSQRVIDLDDLATALDIGLLSPRRASDVLRRTEATTQAIARGEFPFPEIERAHTACRELGW
jgi:hypothetical protein